MLNQYRIAQSHDVEMAYAFAEKNLQLEIPNEMERMMQIWDLPIRKESLEHYFKLGWSFLSFNESQQLNGFFLGQPFLFFQSNTQTLWVECIVADNEIVKSELVEIAIKLSRDKHFQKVILPLFVKNLKYEKPYPFIPFENQLVTVKTTK